jgi:GTPase
MDVGLEDSGESMDFTKADWDFALARLKETADKANADCSVLMTRNVGGTSEVGPLKDDDKCCSGKVLIRRRPASIDEVIETRIAVVGNGEPTSLFVSSLTRPVDAGKSTLLGVLVKGGLDDGRGKARVNLFRHKHEIETGRTSSVGMEIMGFDSKGAIVSSAVAGRKLSWEEIGQRSVFSLDGLVCN